MTYKRMVEFVLLVAGLAGCAPSAPTKTNRPSVSYSNWEERQVQSTESKQTYRYLFAAGPSEDAPTMLLLPGGFFDHRIWLYSGDLAAHFNVYALDWPNDSPFYTGHVQDFATVGTDFLNALGIQELYVAGISAGGFAAQELITTTQDRFNYKAAVLISTHVFSVNKKEWKSRTRRSKLARRLSPDKFRAILQDRVENKEFRQAPGPVQQKDIFWIRPYSYYQEVLDMAINQEDKKQDLEKINCPVLYLHGSEDEILDVEIARESAKAIKNAQYVELPDQDHAMVFHHGPQVTAQMISFLQDKGLI